MTSPIFIFVLYGRIMAWMFWRLPIHTDVAIHAYVWCWGKTCGSLDEIPPVTMGSCKSKTLNELEIGRPVDSSCDI